MDKITIHTVRFGNSASDFFTTSIKHAMNNHSDNMRMTKPINKIVHTTNNPAVPSNASVDIYNYNKV